MNFLGERKKGKSTFLVQIESTKCINHVIYNYTVYFT